MSTKGKSTKTARSVVAWGLGVGVRTDLQIGKEDLFVVIKVFSGIPLVVHWLGLQCFHCWGLGSVPVQGSKIPHAEW